MAWRTNQSNVSFDNLRITGTPSNYNTTVFPLLRQGLIGWLWPCPPSLRPVFQTVPHVSASHQPVFHRLPEGLGTAVPFCGSGWVADKRMRARPYSGN
ncbi:MAG TPA: hypothetical protein PLD25_14485 [Chloroflexota bacterium]|nr:hypothetical protein [Chloroflexota bacterium]